MRDAEVDKFGIKVGGRLISNLRYADDTALCASSYEDTCVLLDNINERGKEKNMKLNAKKTKVMHIGKGQYRDIVIDGETLGRVEDFIYLGSSKSSNGDCKPDVLRRIAQAKTKMVSLKTIWKDRDLSPKLKNKIMKTLVWTTMTYGAEGWTLKAEEKKRIQAADMFCQRRLLNVSWKDKRRNVDILNELQTERELFGAVVKRKVTYFGHMARNKNCSLTKEIIQGKIEAKRKKGRPRMSYMDNLRSWTGMTTNAAFHAAQNREVWRKECWRASRAANAHPDDAADR